MIALSAFAAGLPAAVRRAGSATVPVVPAYTAKRALDLCLVILALPVLVPVVAVIALAIRLTSRGPILYRQTRIGRGGARFEMLKFRSMVADADARRAEVLGSSDRAGLCFKAKDDPRVTPVGRFLRRMSLDELPQMWNVIRGEMSLVGPRPGLPEEVAAYPGHAFARLAVLPGLTGAWQVAGRADLGFDEMVALDLCYLRTQGLLTDLGILFRTVRVVISGRGAY